MSNSFVDDLSSLLAALAHELVPRTVALTDIIFEQTLLFGLRINFSKSVALLAFSGAGSRALTREFHGPGENFLESNKHPFRIPIVGIHKVLGARIIDGVEWGPEFVRPDPP